MFNIGIFIAYTMLPFVITSSSDDIFIKMREDALKSNPVYKSAGKFDYGQDFIMPYYVCDNDNITSAMPLSAWHYSCKQSCSAMYEKVEINITRLGWNYVGDVIPTYKVMTNEVCYTSHENIWGYCSQSQTIKQVPTTLDDKKKIPSEYFTKEKHIDGVKTLVSSSHAECEYLSDNTRCARDYVITYREGKLTKKSDKDPVMLNIYGDGIRTNPYSGSLIQNEAAWFWDAPSQDAETKCGWYSRDDLRCHFTNTSEIIVCPSIGYQYIIKDLVATRICNTGDAYALDSPAPFQYNKKANKKSKETLIAEASVGKSDPDISLLQGINEALDTIEVTYCSSSCDLFARGQVADDNTVLDTPIGTWRLARAKTPSPVMVPCLATSGWKIRSPTTMCHGKNHILVEEASTKHTCSWDTTKNYIITDDLCSSGDREAANDIGLFRKNISEGKSISIDFWTGDKILMQPPYNNPIWTPGRRTIQGSPGWFSKVTLNPDMIHTKEEISELITSMANDAKQEVAFNATTSKSIKRLFFDEVAGGIGGIVSTISGAIMGLLGSIPKLIIIGLTILLILWVIKTAITEWLFGKGKPTTDPTNKVVSFVNSPQFEEDGKASTRYITGKGTRSRSRSRQMGRLLDGMAI